MNELPVLEFKSQAEWQRWLDKNHGQQDGVWLKFAKKDSGQTTLNHSEALESALCYGWIDAKANKFDDNYYVIKFCQRRPRSTWSKINRDKVEKLISEGKMKPAGLAQVEAAKADGHWDKAYLPQSAAEVPEDFTAALAKNKKAAKFFESLTKADKYSFYWRLHHAKRAETRVANIKKFVEILADHQKLH